eukprot:IDg20204t1
MYYPCLSDEVKTNEYCILVDSAYSRYSTSHKDKDIRTRKDKEGGDIPIAADLAVFHVIFEKSITSKRELMLLKGHSRYLQ